MNDRYMDPQSNEYLAATMLFNCHPNAGEPKPLPKEMVKRLPQEGPKLWKLNEPLNDLFKGKIESGTNESLGGVTRVVTDATCEDSCLWSNLPIMAGLYDTGKKEGVYFEVKINDMKGVIGIGNPTLSLVCGPTMF